jgi:hypothetical protein
MITHILAIVILMQMDLYKPELIAPYQSAAECMKAAEESNKIMLFEGDPEGREFVCLEIKRP